MIKIVSFDLDGTLVKSTYANSVWLEGVPEAYAKEKKLSFEAAKEWVFKEYYKIGENRKEWYDIDWWFKHFKLEEDWANLLNKYRYAVELYPDTIDVLKKLSKEYKLIITSNAKKEFIDIQVEETKIRKYFARIFSSISDFKTVKKRPNVYKEICEKLKVKTNEMIHVGDNKEFDFISPEKAGIESYIIDREKKDDENSTISTLHELENILKSKIKN